MTHTSKVSEQKMWRVVVILAAVAVSSGAFIPEASADFQLRIDSGGSGIVTTDTGGIGELAASPTIGPFLANTQGFSKPSIGGITTLGELELHSSITATAAGTINIFLADTGFNAPTGPNTMTSVFTGRISAPEGSLITLNSFVNPANMAPNFGPDVATPAPLVAVSNLPPPGSFTAAGAGGFTVTSTGTPLIFNQVFSGNFNAASPTSLIASVTVMFVGGGGNVDFTDHQSITAVPVPGTIVLMVIGLIAVAAAARRNRARIASAGKRRRPPPVDPRFA